MFSPVDDKALKPNPTVSTKEVGANGRGEGGGIVNHGLSTPSTPTSAYTSSGFGTDIESMKIVPSTEHLRGTPPSGERFDSDSSVWPGQAHWRDKALAAKRKNRSCQCMSRLSRRTRIIVKIAIGLLVVGVAVGVGFGISKSRGARVWRPEDDRR